MFINELYVGSLCTSLVIESNLDNISTMTPAADHLHPTLALRAWQLRNLITTTAMQDFIPIARELGISSLPADWRTVIRQEKGSKLSSRLSEIVEVCGSCSLHRFPPLQVSTARKCANCGYARLHCPRCDYRCILASTIGNKSRKSVGRCNHCGVNSDIKFSVRSYIMDIVDNIRFLFSSKKRALDLLSPFQSATCALYTVQSPVTGLGHSDASQFASFQVHDNWLENWREACKTVPYFKELWHGERFYMHRIFEQHGMRSVLLEVSLDWFPPHKDKNYSVGVLSCCPANLTMNDRSNLDNVFVLAVIEGPKEPVHTLALLQPVFKKIAQLSRDGVKVFDCLSNCEIVVHACVGLCVCDTPAAARLGSFIGHSGYLPCVKCCYKASLCGCKFDNAALNLKRSTWNNESITSPDSTTRPSIFPSPGTKDDFKKKQGEHFSFVDSNLIQVHQLRNNADIRRDQVKVGLFVWTPGYMKAHYEQMKADLRVTGVSPLLILPPETFDFVHDFALDGMHTLLKGIALRLIELTFSDKHKTETFNLQHKDNKSKLLDFANRMRRFKWSTRDSSPHNLHKTSGGLKAAEIWFFFRVQCLVVLEDLIPHRAYIVWTLLAEIIAGVMHTHVPKAWMNGAPGTGLSRLTRSFYERFLGLYGKCNMPVNFHLFLHVQHDCNDWSTLQSHSTFKFERLYHELIVAPRSNGSNKFTQSIVRAVCAFRARAFQYSGINGPSKFGTSFQWPTFLPPQHEIPCLKGMNGATSNQNLFKSALDEFGTKWNVGDFMTIIDYSSGTSIYLGESMACKVECLLSISSNVIALLYPAHCPSLPLRKTLGSFIIGKQVGYEISKIMTINLSLLPQHVHISHVARYMHPNGPITYIPLCGPLPNMYL